jgi:hypothetical protein
MLQLPPEEISQNNKSKLIENTIEKKKKKLREN